MTLRLKNYGPLKRFSFVDEMDKIHAYHLLESDRGVILFDTGKASTPHHELSEALDQLNLAWEDLIYVFFTHADADHIGGNSSLRDIRPDLPYAAHPSDIPYIERKDFILRNRYRQFESYGVYYDQNVLDTIDSMMETDQPVDVPLREGSQFRINDRRILEVTHLPGHSPGHLGFLLSEGSINRENNRSTRSLDRILIAGDAVYPEGAFTVEGEQLQPPPYENLSDYLKTIEKIHRTDPDVLLLSHFEPLTDRGIVNFLERSLDWVKNFHQFFVKQLLRKSEKLTIPQIIDDYVEEFGEVGLDEDIAYASVAHLNYCRSDEVYEVIEHTKEGLPAFTINSRGTNREKLLSIELPDLT